MNAVPDKSETSLKTIDVLAIILFCGQFFGWIVGIGPLIQAYAVVFETNPGDELIGVIIVAFCAMGIGLIVTLISLPFALFAKQLPLSIRCLLILLPAVAFALGIILFELA